MENLFSLLSRSSSSSQCWRVLYWTRGKSGEAEEEEEDEAGAERSGEMGGSKAGAKKASKAEAEYESDVSLTACRGCAYPFS